MKPINHTKIFKKYKGLWVALRHNEQTVVSSGKTLKEAVEKAHKKGCKNPIMTHMPTELISSIGGAFV